jgi:glycosyltransferase involved in cell wall biosynthesis
VIAAVATSMNEADIIGDTVTHLLDQGVELVLIADASTDDTREILAALPVTVYDDTEPCHRQPWWISRLANDAFEKGATWVVPFDADEYWCPTTAGTLTEAFSGLPESVWRVPAPMYQHINRRWREPHPKPLNKVAFRAHPNPRVANGNHDVYCPGNTQHGTVEIREIQFRSFEHFVRKIAERCATLDPSLPAGEGTHITQYAGWPPERLRPVWEQMLARATVEDPIP